MYIGMLSLLILLTILILKADGRPPDNDLPSHQNLTYGPMYNNTHLALLQSILSPYNRLKSLRKNDKYGYNDSWVNELEDQPLYDDPSDPLLVGFAENPFGYSVSEDEYMKRFRDMDLQIYQNRTGNRHKRSLLQLYNMISCATNCDPLSYNGYGCYCGLNGEGVSMNAIDRCCEAHDKCYDDINRPWYVVYLQPYFWQCHYGRPKCGVENSYKLVKFFFGSAAKLCECDRKFAMCLRRYRCPKKRQVCQSSPRRQLQNEVMVYLMNEITKELRQL